MEARHTQDNGLTSPYLQKIQGSLEKGPGSNNGAGVPYSCKKSQPLTFEHEGPHPTAALLYICSPLLRVKGVAQDRGYVIQACLTSGTGFREVGAVRLPVSQLHFCAIIREHSSYYRRT